MGDILKKVGDGSAGNVVVVVLALFLFSGCASIPAEVPDPNVPSEEAVPSVQKMPEDFTSIEKMIYSENYEGYLTVHFKQELKVRIGKDAVFESLADSSDDLARVNSMLRDYNDIKIEPFSDQDPGELEAARLKLVENSGAQLEDFGSIFELRISDSASAVALLRALKEIPAVAKVYPSFYPMTASISSTPSLAAHQGYLNAESTHGGLNAIAAWGGNVYGAGVYVVDNEPGLNPFHEDLVLSTLGISQGGNYLRGPLCLPDHFSSLPKCDAYNAHGTAIAGILVGRHNSHGVDGFAPQSYYLHSGGNGSQSVLQAATDGIDDPGTSSDDDVEPGSVWLIETQTIGKYSTTSDCDSGDAACEYGYMPTEIIPSAFAAIRQAIAYGVTVVSVAGNGQMNLDDGSLYSGDWSFVRNLAHEDAGSIMVGASTGQDKQKISFSNCGGRVNSFAWGVGVATTGSPYGLYAWNGTTLPVPANSASDPNNYYINNFGGTSSAAAMVAGAAALIQSHAKLQLGSKRYLAPQKMREIVTSSGVSQTGSGCNIGTQPRVDVALGQVDSFVVNVRQAFPELVNGQRLTTQRLIDLRQMGIGVVCIYQNNALNDAICPLPDNFRPGTRIAKDFDFDGDGKADLVQWTNGRWKIDLSGRGAGQYNFGSWDLEIDYAPIEGGDVVPYVEDYNSDGREDFAVYARRAGKWYVAFTDTALVRDGLWHGWDMELDYSSGWRDELTLDPNVSRYSRPLPNDYNGDGWIDIAIACSDGKFRIDFGGRDASNFGHFDSTVDFLGTQELAAAPGWAYLPVSIKILNSAPAILGYKGPNGTSFEGKLKVRFYDDPTDVLAELNLPQMFGGNEKVFAPGFYQGRDEYISFGLKDSIGNWPISLFVEQNTMYLPFINYDANFTYGDTLCYPISADFNGDNFDDRAVMCPDEWWLAITPAAGLSLPSTIAPVSVSLSYDVDEFALPGRPISGGLNYTYVRSLIDFAKALSPNTAPAIPVDMGFGAGN